MKSLKLLVFAVLFISAASVQAQKFAYVDSEYILENVPEYQAAQKELDKLSTQWQTEMEKRYKDIEALYAAYQAEQVLLTPEMKAKRENAIIAKEEAAKEFQREKFGVEGALFQKREELIKPIQDKVYEGIKEVVAQYGYDMIFDKSTQSNILFADEKLDKSDVVLRKMGIKKGID